MKVRSQPFRYVVSASLFMTLVVRLQADYYVAHNGSNAAPYGNWATAATNIQTVVDEAESGSTIWVADGTYSTIQDQTEIISLSEKSLTFYGNPNTPGSVVLDGKSTHRGLRALFGIVGQTLDLNGFTFSNCYASYPNGGGICLDISTSGKATVQNCVFVQNQVAKNRNGGAVGCEGTPETDFDLVFSNCVFSANSANSGGAGTTAEIRSITLENCRAVGNVTDGTFGGGAFWFYNTRSVNVRGCTFLSNRCENAHGGGALYTYSSPCALTDCYFEENEAIRGVGSAYTTGLGGAIYSRSSLVATNCVFRNNRANSSFSYGGAVYVAATSPQTWLYNCLVVGNLSNESNSEAIYGANQTAGEYLIVNSTIVSNSAGVGVYGNNTAPSVEIHNSIIHYNHHADGMTDNFYLVGDGLLKLYNTATDPTPTGNLDGGENITDDPKFVSLAGGDFRLQLGSPCIDTGLNQDWMIDAVDLDGRLRIDHFAQKVDMGCYEYQKSGSVVIIL